MSTRYAPLPNPQTDPLLNDEMEAAFDDDEEEEGDHDGNSESRPLNPASRSSSAPHTPTPGIYDFENFDYASLPPPGSPPRPSSSALPNEIGNSNGFVPSPLDVRPIDGPRTNWFRRKARSLLPNSLVHRLHLDYELTTPNVVGSGTNNDGVFANVTAKPSRPVQLRDGPSLFFFLASYRFSSHPSHLQVTMCTSFRKSLKRMHHPLTLQLKPTQSHLTGKRPFMPHPLPTR